MASASTPPRVHVSAYLQHLEQKKKTEAGDHAVHNLPSPLQPLNRRSASPMHHRVSTPTTAAKPSIPVWKQRQLRSMEYQKQPSSKAVLPPPPPPPPAFGTGSFTGNHTFCTPTKTKQSLTSTVPPETPFSHEVSPSSSPRNSTPQTAASTPTSVSRKPSSISTRNISNSSTSSGASTRAEQNKFGFFKATSPRHTGTPKSVDEKIKPVAASFSITSSSDQQQQQQHLDKHTSNSTQETYLSSSSDDEEEEPVSPTPAPAKALASAWEEQIQRAAAVKQQKLVSPPRTATVQSNVSTPTKEQPESPTSPTSTALIVAQDTFEQVDDDFVEEGSASTTPTPLKVTSQPNSFVAAKWQEKIRQKQGKNPTPLAVVPSSSPHTHQRIFQATASGSANQGFATTPTRPEISAMENSFDSPFFPNSNNMSPPPMNHHVTDMVHVDTDPSYYYAQQGVMVPFQHSPMDDEKKDAEDQLVVRSDDQADFDDVVQTLALNWGATKGWDDELDAELFQNSVCTDMLLEMIHDCEMRWKDSSKLSRMIAPSPLLYLNAPTDPDQAAQLIQLQKAEIAQLRAQLAIQQDGTKKLETTMSTALTTATSTAIEPAAASVPSSSVAQASSTMVEASVPESSAPGSSVVSPVEQIDTVPIEHIEVAHTDDPDVCSVTSGLTNLIDLGRDIPSLAAAATTSSFADPFLFETTTSSHHSQTRSDNHRGTLSSKIVRRVPVQLRAADGSNRKALYTGPVLSNGQFTGFGYFQFEGTGDVYKGEVQNGKMHGQGTYTYARRSRKHKSRPHKVLRGTFENNVFTGWDPNMPGKS